MLAIRMQRTGRKGHAMFRVVVQDARRTPTSGKVVVSLGSYDPHTKAVVLNKDKAAYYLEHGAQPSDRVVKLLITEGVKLPEWVNKPSKDMKRDIRNAEKLRRNRPVSAETSSEAEATEDKPEKPTAKADAAAEPTVPAETVSENEVVTEEKDETEPEAKETVKDEATPAEEAEKAGEET